MITLEEAEEMSMESWLKLSERIQNHIVSQYLGPKMQTRKAPRKGCQRRYKPNCANGHPLDGDNLGVQSNGRRYCKACNNASAKRSAAKRRTTH